MPSHHHPAHQQQPAAPVDASDSASALRDVDMLRQLSGITLDEDTTSASGLASSSEAGAPLPHAQASTSARPPVGRSHSAPQSSASEREEGTNGSGSGPRRFASPARTLREAQIDQRLRAHKRSAPAAHAQQAPPPRLLRASTESDVMTLRKLATQSTAREGAKPASPPPAAALQRAASRIAKAKAPGTKLQDRRRRTKRRGERKLKKSAAAAAANGNISSASGSEPRLDRAQQQQAQQPTERAAYHYESDDLQMQQQHDADHASSSETPPVLLTAAALIAAAQAAVTDERARLHVASGLSSGGASSSATAAYVQGQEQWAASSRSLLSSYSSSSSAPDEMDADDAASGSGSGSGSGDAAYALHLGPLPDHIESLRSELLAPSEMRWYRLPLLEAHANAMADAQHRGHTLAARRAGTDSYRSQHAAKMHLHASSAAPHAKAALAAEAEGSGAAAAGPDARYVSMRSLERDWDEWRWESVEHGDVMKAYSPAPRSTSLPPAAATASAVPAAAS